MKVSIAIPFYNAEKYLRDSIRSVFAQTHQDWELILMDDGSTDGSLAIAKSIKDSRVSVYSDGKNKKLAARLNEITKLAKYDIIARMDADDLMSPTRIEKQLNILKDNLNIEVAPTSLYIDNIREILEESDISVISQNFDLENLGSYTGGVCLDQLKEIGITKTILGHSERRSKFNESYDQINKKLEIILKSELDVIFVLIVMSKFLLS